VVPTPPAAVLDHLVRTHGGHAELQEYVSGRWVRIAASGEAPVKAVATRIGVRSDLALAVSGQASPVTPGLLAGFAAQAAAALDRERLRTQAAQAEALAEGNRMRTALLAAVSHDLRTPLASIKASVSSLRQTDVAWTESDEEALLATIEQNADRLDGLIGNLLDMSRLHTGSLQPFLRPITIDEVAPIALVGLDASANLRLGVPDGMPLVLADPGSAGAGPGEPVLERAVPLAVHTATLPAGPTRFADTVVLEVVDHGPGVPDELKARIFEPFQRFDDRKVGVGTRPRGRQGLHRGHGRCHRRRPTRRAAGSRSGSRCRSQPRAPTPCRAPALDPRAGRRRRAVDPPGAADQPQRAELSGQHRKRRRLRAGGDGPRPPRRDDPRPRAARHGRHRSDPRRPRLGLDADHRAVGLGA
jgi:signal transduction histidine kinase